MPEFNMHTTSCMGCMIFYSNIKKLISVFFTYLGAYKLRPFSTRAKILLACRNLNSFHCDAALATSRSQAGC